MRSSESQSVPDTHVSTVIRIFRAAARSGDRELQRAALAELRRFGIRRSDLRSPERTSRINEGDSSDA